VSERLRWLGHATVGLEIGGARLLTDPVLRRRIAHLRRHAAPAEPPPALDAVLISHVHHDHLDLPTLRGLDPTARLILPAGAARIVSKLGREVEELSPGESTTVAGARVLAVEARHDGKRGPLSKPAETLGFVIEGASRVYFAGDTEVFPGMAELGPVDVALLPIWGWGFSLGPGHMDPEEAAEATALVAPRVAVPIHWGTLLPITARARHLHLLTLPPERYTAHAAARAPGTEVRVLQPGGEMAL
jgi:L-ascorbate metabolism protein UlaG (beta-lactamase superfamily)